MPPSFRVGTSGFSYKEWKGSFYPEDLKPAEMLGHYAGRLAAVEINNTFYRLPRRELLEGWACQVPEHFRFALKASRRITHFKRLKPEAASELSYLTETAAVLGERLGPLLFQLPPNFKKESERLAAFADLLAPGSRAAFEFRHPSWFDDEIFALMRAKNLSLVIADTGGESDPPLVATADWGYLRLRRQDYGERDLSDWADRIRGQAWSDVYVFFKHEDEAAGPRLAEEFQRRLRGRP